MKRPVSDDYQWPQHYRPLSRSFDREAVKDAAVRLIEARKPAILAGHGINLANAQPELKELAQLLSIPVATTPKAKGAFPEDHELSLRVFGLASSPLAEGYLLSDSVDVLFVLGSSMHEISTQGWDPRLQPSSALLQQDIDSSVIGRNYPVTVGLVGDAKTTLRELIFHIKRVLQRGEHPRSCDSAAFLTWKKGLSPVSDPEKMRDISTPLKPQRVIHELNEALPDDAIVFLDVGNHALWAIHYLNADAGKTIIHNWGEFAAMGTGIAGSIGGKIAAPERPVVAIVGDGGFGMAGMEVSTAVTYDIPVVWIVFNDGRLNTVHHGQQMQYQGRTCGTAFHRMDIAKIAEGLGAVGRRITKPDLLGAALKDALRSGKPTVLDVWIDPDEVPPIHSRVESLERFFKGAENISCKN
jgi:acetolactate synthase-1/2/3 large subunit